MFNPFDAILIYYDTFWGTYLSEVDEAHRRKEMHIQLRLVCPGKSEEEITPHDVERLERIAGAARAFLAQNRSITEFTHWPPVHAWEELYLRRFIRQFLRLERGLARRAGLSTRQWRERHERNLSKVVAANGELYALVAAGRCNEPVQQQLQASLSVSESGAQQTG